MNENPVQTTTPVPPVEQVLIAGKPMGYYWRMTRLFVILAVLLDIINAWLGILSYGRWIILGVVVLFLAWWSSHRGTVTMRSMLIAGGFFGILTGLTLAIIDIIWYHQWWYALNLVRLPILIGVLGIGVSFIGYFLFRSLLVRREQSQTKGGGIYGRTKKYE